jgi:hypothetical protein
MARATRKETIDSGHTVKRYAKDAVFIAYTKGEQLPTEVSANSHLNQRTGDP